jgi:phosphatidylinositol-3-phosphatase
MRPKRLLRDRRGLVVLLAAGIVLLALVVPATAKLVEPDGASRASAPSGICGWRDTPPARYDHVVWVLLENHSRPQLIGPAGSREADRSPYLNSLARRCGLATNYLALTHPSLPNYLALTSGSTGGVRRTCTPDACPQRRTTIFDQLAGPGGGWRIYAEGMPSACHRRDSGRYVVRHNPATYFPVADCAAHDVPLGTATRGRLVDDLAAGRLPALTLVVPDQCHNTHDCAIDAGDEWLSQMVPRLVRSPLYRAGRTAVVVTWDEGAGGTRGQDCRAHPDRSCRVATVVLSPTTRPGTRSSVALDHYSLLEATSRMLGVPPLGHAADRTTRDLRPAFGL